MKPAVVPEFRMIQLLRDYYGVDERWRFTDTHRRTAPLPRRMRRSTRRRRRAVDAATTRDEVVDGGCWRSASASSAA